MTGRVGRRAFLIGSVAAVGGAAAVGIRELTTDSGSALRRSLARVVPGADSVKAIGEAYLASLVEPARMDALAREIVPPRRRSMAEAWLIDVDADRLTRHLRVATSRDFAAGRTVAVGGWGLARVEAALSGLWALVD